MDHESTTISYPGFASVWSTTSGARYCSGDCQPRHLNAALFAYLRSSDHRFQKGAVLHCSKQDSKRILARSLLCSPILASPKSATLTFGGLSAVNKIFSGLRSRCATPSLCCVHLISRTSTARARVSAYAVQHRMTNLSCEVHRFALGCKMPYERTATQTTQPDAHKVLARDS